ncbi:MAG: PEPxxWA-CTERM sorting domain-containing protein [Pseudomonadota bacterium]
MKLTSGILLAGAVAILSPATAGAQTYSSTFSNLGTQGDGFGYYFFDIHGASQAFSGTGVTAATQFELDLIGGTGGFYASEALSLTFQINGETVGSTTYNPGDPASRQLSFIFNPIASQSTDYTLSAFVSDPVCDGCGALRLSADNPFRLSGATSVPEPSTWAMLLLGFGVSGFALRRSRKSPQAAPAT